jgi:hypothetical protein
MSTRKPIATGAPQAPPSQVPVCCPHCGSPSIVLRRRHTVWETYTVRFLDTAGTYVEEDAGHFGETQAIGPWEDATCAHCEADLDVQALLPTQDAPGTHSDPDAFLAYWHDGEALGHWSSDGGCHVACPVCRGAEPDPDDA